VAGSVKQVDVLVAGLNVVDVLARLPAVVRRGQKHEVAQLTITGGGPAGNAACGMAALGLRVGFLGRLGGDTLSRTARADFQTHGVSTDHLIADPDARPAVAIVEIDPATGDRTVFYTLDGYRSLTTADAGAADLTGVRLLLVDGYEAVAARTLLVRARAAGIRSVLDLEAGEPDTLRELLSLGTDVILPHVAAARLAETEDLRRQLAILSGLTAGTVVVTDGLRGSWALPPGGTIVHQPAFPVADVVDTTGCGDAYHAAYAVALLDELPLPRRMEFAALVASRVARQFGGRTDLPTRATLATADDAGLSAELKRHLSQPQTRQNGTTDAHR
jgi:sulfofructose kinase